MKKETITKDPYALYRHITFHYLHYYLESFFQSHQISKHSVNEDSGFGGRTLEHLLKGKDMHFNCHLRLLAAMRDYCKDNDEYLDFIMEFMKRAIIEIWLIWEEELEEWMLDTWEEMLKEKDKYTTRKDCLYNNK